MLNLSALFATALFSVGMVIISETLRKTIKYCAFYGLDRDTAKQFVKEQSFRSRVLMIYIWKLKPEGEQYLGSAKWFLVWHYINLISYFASFTMLWVDVVSHEFIGHDVLGNNYMIGTFTYTNLSVMLLVVFLGTVPASMILSLPWTRKMKWGKDNDGK
ncbi:MAG: hypothetical protein FWD05_11745 [Oscillospiraceae bacterium]|nr:hypothetical protein [Oscillospiraceae bacterium]